MMQGKKIIQELLEYMEEKLDSANFSKIKIYFMKLSKINLNKSEADLFGETILKYIDVVINISAKKEYRQQLKFCRHWLNVIPEIVTEQLQTVFMKKVSRRILEILIEEDTSGWCIKKVLLKVFMVFVRNVTKEVRHNITKSLPDIFLFKIVDSISTYGDFDLQVNLIELVFRMYGKNIILPKLTELLPESQELSESFAKINGDTFDEDVRSFLNILNKTSGKVFSILCTDVFMGHIKCGEPIENIGGIWVDFNLSENAVSFYCTKDSLDDGSPEENEPLWEMEMFFVNDVDFVQVDRIPENNRAVIFIKLNVPCISSCDEVLDNVTKAKDIKFLVSYGSNKTTILISKILPNMFKHKFRHNSLKVSLGKKSVYKPLKVSIVKRRRSESSKTRSDSFTSRMEPLVSISDTSSSRNVSRRQSTSSVSTRCEVISISNSDSSDNESSIDLVPKQRKVDVNTRETQYETAPMCPIDHMLNPHKVSRNKLVLKVSTSHASLILHDNPFVEHFEEHGQVQILSKRCSRSKSLHSQNPAVVAFNSSEQRSDSSDQFETAQEFNATSDLEDGLAIPNKSRRVLEELTQEKENKCSSFKCLNGDSNESKISAPLSKCPAKKSQNCKRKEQEKKDETLEGDKENEKGTTQSNEQCLAKNHDDILTVNDSEDLAFGSEDQQKSEPDLVTIDQRSSQVTENLFTADGGYDLLEGLSQKEICAIKETGDAEVVTQSSESQQNAASQSAKISRGKKYQTGSKEEKEVVEVDGNNLVEGMVQDVLGDKGLVTIKHVGSDILLGKRRRIRQLSSTTDDDVDIIEEKDKSTTIKRITKDSNNELKNRQQRASATVRKKEKKKKAVNRNNKQESMSLCAVDKHSRQEVLQTKTVEKVGEQGLSDKTVQNDLKQSVVKLENAIIVRPIQKEVEGIPNVEPVRHTEEMPHLKELGPLRKAMERSGHSTTTVKEKINISTDEDGLEDLNLSHMCEIMFDELKKHDFIEKFTNKENSLGGKDQCGESTSVFDELKMQDILEKSRREENSLEMKDKCGKSQNMLDQNTQNLTKSRNKENRQGRKNKREVSKNVFDQLNAQNVLDEREDQHGESKTMLDQPKGQNLLDKSKNKDSLKREDQHGESKTMLDQPKGQNLLDKSKNKDSLKREDQRGESKNMLDQLKVRNLADKSRNKENRLESILGKLKAQNFFETSECKEHSLESKDQYGKGETMFDESKMQDILEKSRSKENSLEREDQHGDSNLMLGQLEMQDVPDKSRSSENCLERKDQHGQGESILNKPKLQDFLVKARSTESSAERNVQPEKGEHMLEQSIVQNFYEKSRSQDSCLERRDQRGEGEGIPDEWKKQYSLRKSETKATNDEVNIVNSPNAGSPIEEEGLESSSQDTAINVCNAQKVNDCIVVLENIYENQRDVSKLKQAKSKKFANIVENVLEDNGKGRRGKSKKTFDNLKVQDFPQKSRSEETYLDRNNQREECEIMFDELKKQDLLKKSESSATSGKVNIVNSPIAESPIEEELESVSQGTEIHVSDVQKFNDCIVVLENVHGNHREVPREKQIDPKNFADTAENAVEDNGKDQCGNSEKTFANLNVQDFLNNSRNRDSCLERRDQRGEDEGISDELKKQDLLEKFESRATNIQENIVNSPNAESPIEEEGDEYFSQETEIHVCNVQKVNDCIVVLENIHENRMVPRQKQVEPKKFADIVENVVEDNRKDQCGKSKETFDYRKVHDFLEKSSSKVTCLERKDQHEDGSIFDELKKLDLPETSRSRSTNVKVNIVNSPNAESPIEEEGLESASQETEIHVCNVQKVNDCIVVLENIHENHMELPRQKQVEPKKFADIVENVVEDNDTDQCSKSRETFDNLKSRNTETCLQRKDQHGDGESLFEEPKKEDFLDKFESRATDDEKDIVNSPNEEELETFSQETDIHVCSIQKVNDHIQVLENVHGSRKNVSRRKQRELKNFIDVIDNVVEDNNKEDQCPKSENTLDNLNGQVFVEKSRSRETSLERKVQHMKKQNYPGKSESKETSLERDDQHTKKQKLPGKSGSKAIEVNIVNSPNAESPIGKDGFESYSQQTKIHMRNAQKINGIELLETIHQNRGDVPKQKQAEPKKVVDIVENVVEDNGNKTNLNESLSTTLWRREKRRKLYDPKDLSYMENITKFEDDLDSRAEVSTSIVSLKEKTLAKKTKVNSKPVKVAVRKGTPTRRVHRKKQISHNMTKHENDEIKFGNSRKLRHSSLGALRLRSTFFEILDSYSSVHETKSDEMQIEKEPKKAAKMHKKRRKTPHMKAVDNERVVSGQTDLCQSDISRKLPENSIICNEDSILPSNEDLPPEKKINIISDIRIKSKRVYEEDERRTLQKRVKVEHVPKEQTATDSDNIKNQGILRWIETGHTDCSQLAMERRAIFKFLYPSFEHLIRQPDESKEYRAAVTICNMLENFS